MLVQENISLKPYNTFGIDATAKYFASFQTIDDLKILLNDEKVKSEGFKLVLGGGSNLLLTKNVDGIVLKNEVSGISVEK